MPVLRPGTRPRGLVPLKHSGTPSPWRPVPATSWSHQDVFWSEQKLWKQRRRLPQSCAQAEPGPGPRDQDKPDASPVSATEAGAASSEEQETTREAESETSEEEDTATEAGSATTEEEGAALEDGTATEESTTSSEEGGTAAGEGAPCPEFQPVQGHQPGFAQIPADDRITVVFDLNGVLVQARPCRCLDTAPSRPRICPDNALTLPWHCPDNAPTLL